MFLGDGVCDLFWMTDDFIVKINYDDDSIEVYSSKDANKIITLSRKRFELLCTWSPDEVIGFLDKKTRRIFPATF
jgi:hypothetical protein